MKLFSIKKKDKNLPFFDVWSLAHFLMGQIATLFIFPIIYLISLLFSFEIGFVNTIIIAIIAFGWEYIENGIFKKFDYFKRIKLIKKIFEGYFIIDSWENCLTDIICVFLGSFMSLYIGYNFFPNMVAFISLNLLIIFPVYMLFLIGLLIIEIKGDEKNNAND